MPIESTKALTPHELNPRKITPEQLARLDKSLEAYGDLSGIVFNRRTRKQVGGHQRCKLIEEDAPIDCKYFDQKDAQGTVGLGHVITKKFGRLVYREVDWPKEIEYAAMIAANSHGGDWDDALLRQTLTLISEVEGDGAVNPETIGLEDEFLGKLFRGQELNLNVQEQEQKALTEPLTVNEVKNLPSQTAMIQLFFTIESRPKIIETIRKLQVVYGTASLTETVQKAVDFAYEKCDK